MKRKKKTKQTSELKMPYWWWRITNGSEKEQNFSLEESKLSINSGWVMIHFIDFTLSYALPGNLLYAYTQVHIAVSYHS